jgi:plasmid stabilization system protein ParE
MADILVTWTPFALRCLDEIHYFISEEARSTSPADKFVEKIFNRTSQLIHFPESGQQELFLTDRGIPARYLIEGNYKIVYDYLEDKRIIVVMDIFHTDQNPSKIIDR